MKRLTLVASLVLVSACSAGDDEYRLTARLVNSTSFSQKVVMKGSVLRSAQDSGFAHTLPFNQTITAPALGTQRVSVLDPFDSKEVLILYKGDCLTVSALTPSSQTVGAWEGMVISHDVDCTITREGSTADGSEGSVKCGTEPLPEAQADLEGKPGACDAVRAAQP